MFPNDYLYLIDSITKTNTIEEIHGICSKAVENFGFERFIYGARIPTSFTQPYMFIISSYPDEWRDRYTAENYIAIDPTVSYCARNILPLEWSLLHQTEKDNQRVQKFMDEARDFGLNNGISFAVHNAQGEFAMFSLSSENTSEAVREKARTITPFAQLFSAHLHEAVRRVIDIKEIPLMEPKLTEREKECLLWAAEGKTSWEMAQIMRISERTVIHYLQCVTEKMKVTNRQHAVARAVSSGLISPKLG